MRFLRNLVADAGNTASVDALLMDDMLWLAIVYSVALGIMLLFAIITLVAMWRVFAKAGIPAWKCLIPVYNLYVMYKHFWNTKAFGRYILWYVLYNVIDLVLRNVPMTENVYFIVFSVFNLISLIMIINFERLNYHLAKSFDRGFLFSLGLTFLSPFFHWILGLGDCDYVGDTYDYYY